MLALWIVGRAAPCPNFPELNSLARGARIREHARQAMLLPAIPSLSSILPAVRPSGPESPVSGGANSSRTCPHPLPWFMPAFVHMTRLHLHLLSDSTGETLEMVAKAALAQFDDTQVIRHFWPMVRSQQHLDRIVGELATIPGLVLYTLVNHETRARLEERCRALGLPLSRRSMP